MLTPDFDKKPRCKPDQRAGGEVEKQRSTRHRIPNPMSRVLGIEPYLVGLGPRPRTRRTLIASVEPTQTLSPPPSIHASFPTNSLERHAPERDNGDKRANPDGAHKAARHANYRAIQTPGREPHVIAITISEPKTSAKKNVAPE